MMALWPFRRKSGRKRPRSGAALSDAEGLSPRAQTDDMVARAASKKKQRTDHSKLQRRPRAYSFSPGRQDSLGVDQSRTSHERAALRGRSRTDDPMVTTGWERTPTLHHTKSKSRPTRRKTSKRKQEDHDRAAQIKAMSNFTPVRPATDAATAGRPMKKDSRRFRAAPGFGGQPASDVSLPIPDSIHSSMSSDSEFGSYKVFASLAPRPTLRYAPGPRWTSAHSSAAAHAFYEQSPAAGKQVMTDEAYRRHKRIDDLANELDSSDLRELMEREDKRREKKRQRDRDRAERRLARQAERQKREEAAARKAGTPPPENLERGVAGRELVGLGIDPPSTVRTSSKHRTSGSSEQLPDAEPIEQTADSRQPSPKGSPLASFHRPDSVIMEDALPEPAVESVPVTQPTPQTEAQDSTTSLPQSSRGSRLGGLLRSKKSRSKSTLGSERDKAISPPPGTIDEEETTRRSSTGSDKRGRFTLSSFLRWGGKRRRNSAGPSSFSNTSREEMQAAVAAHALAQAQSQAQAQAQPRALSRDKPSASTEQAGGVYISRKLSTSGITRTRSRFREDLPDFPISPPDSRLQSPEPEPPLPALVENSPKENRTQPIPIPSPKHDSLEATHHNIHSIDRTQGVSPETHMSMSLASIDSEGSWLSGRAKPKRSSVNRESFARASQLGRSLSTDSPTNSTQDDLPITDDDYLSRITSDQHSPSVPFGRPSGEGRPSSDYEEYSAKSGARWGAVGAHAQVVQSHSHDRTTMLSQEGLLNMDSGDDDDVESPITPTALEKVEETADERAGVQRARSVHLGRGHVRNFSAGSAKLLDLTPRSSVDGRSRNREENANNVA
jgi:hypothetical protein